MPASLDLLNRAIGVIYEQFGTTQFQLEGAAAPMAGSWNELGRTEVLEINGRRVSFSVLVEVKKSDLAEVFPRQGLLVTRTSDGKIFRITGEVDTDELTVRFPLDSKNK